MSGPPAASGRLTRPRHPEPARDRGFLRESCPALPRTARVRPAAAGSGVFPLCPPPPEMFLFLILARAGMWLRGQGPRSYFGGSLFSPRLWPAGHPWSWLLRASLPNSLTTPSPPPAKKKKSPCKAEVLRAKFKPSQSLTPWLSHPRSWPPTPPPSQASPLSHPTPIPGLEKGALPDHSEPQLAPLEWNGRAHLWHLPHL